MTIWAHIEPESLATDRRRASRQRVRLDVLGTPGTGEAARVAIRDLSLDGFLIQTSVHLRVGELLEVDFPEAGPVRAEVMWGSSQYFGCQFDRPISKATLSAALLRSEPDIGDEQLPPGNLGAILDELKLLRDRVQRVGAYIDHLTDRIREDVGTDRARPTSETEVDIEDVRSAGAELSYDPRQKETKVEEDEDLRLPLESALLILFVSALALWVSFFWLIGLI